MTNLLQILSPYIAVASIIFVVIILILKYYDLCDDIKEILKILKEKK